LANNAQSIPQHGWLGDVCGVLPLLAPTKQAHCAEAGGEERERGFPFKSFGSLAMFAAMRRASLAPETERPPPLKQKDRLAAVSPKSDHVF
jgi:hypothetical protein